MAIQLFVPTFRIEECLEEIRECLEKGWTGIGFKTIAFEEEWKKYTGLPYAHFLNSATAALHLAIKVLKEREGWADGDEVISTPLTFVSTNHAITYEQLKVVFADVDDTLCLDPRDVERKITPRTRAIVFVGIGGNIGHYDEIVQLCHRYHLKLILDAAHMAGTKRQGECIGKEADVVCYSFQAVKNLPTADSGMVCFKEEADDQMCRRLSWLGINKDTYARAEGQYKWKYDVDEIGYKYNGNAIMAAIALVQLKYLDEDNAYRRQIAQWYDEGFRKYSPQIQTIPIPSECECSRHLYIIRVSNRDEVMTYLNNKEIFPGVHYLDNTTYKVYDYARGSCPHTTLLNQQILSLPMHLRLTKEEVDYVIQCVIEGVTNVSHK